MRLRVIAVGDRMPDWIDAGVEDYRARLPRAFALEVVAVRPAPRGEGRPVSTMLAAEAQRLRAATPQGHVTVALDERGRALATRALAGQIERWRERAPGVAFWIGGPDGLDAQLRDSANFQLSLSALTLPHALARLVLVEQIYRCVSLIGNHPYHRD
jgi:23S rRNA (pseudouridine1915-N3)-methyltransferase